MGILEDVLRDTQQLAEKANWLDQGADGQIPANPLHGAGYSYQDAAASGGALASRWSAANPGESLPAEYLPAETEDNSKVYMRRSRDGLVKAVPKANAKKLRSLGWDFTTGKQLEDSQIKRDTSNRGLEQFARRAISAPTMGLSEKIIETATLGLPSNLVEEIDRGMQGLPDWSTPEGMDQRLKFLKRHAQAIGGKSIRGSNDPYPPAEEIVQSYIKEKGQRWKAEEKYDKKQNALYENNFGASLTGDIAGGFLSATRFSPVGRLSQGAGAAAGEAAAASRLGQAVSGSRVLSGALKGAAQGGGEALVQAGATLAEAELSRQELGWESFALIGIGSVGIGGVLGGAAGVPTVFRDFKQTKAARKLIDRGRAAEKAGEAIDEQFARVKNDPELMAAREKVEAARQAELMARGNGPADIDAKTQLDAQLDEIADGILPESMRAKPRKVIDEDAVPKWANFRESVAREAMAGPDAFPHRYGGDARKLIIDRQRQGPVSPGEAAAKEAQRARGRAIEEQMRAKDAARPMNAPEHPEAGKTFAVSKYDGWVYRGADEMLSRVPKEIRSAVNPNLHRDFSDAFKNALDRGKEIISDIDGEVGARIVLRELTDGEAANLVYRHGADQAAAASDEAVLELVAGKQLPPMVVGKEGNRLFVQDGEKWGSAYSGAPGRRPLALVIERAGPAGEIAFKSEVGQAAKQSPRDQIKTGKLASEDLPDAPDALKDEIKAKKAQETHRQALEEAGLGEAKTFEDLAQVARKAADILEGKASGAVAIDAAKKELSQVRRELAAAEGKSLFASQLKKRFDELEEQIAAGPTADTQFTALAADLRKRADGIEATLRKISSFTGSRVDPRAVAKIGQAESVYGAAELSAAKRVVGEQAATPVSPSPSASKPGVITRSMAFLTGAEQPTAGSVAKQILGGAGYVAGVGAAGVAAEGLGIDGGMKWGLGALGYLLGRGVARSTRKLVNPGSAPYRLIQKLDAGVRRLGDKASSAGRSLRGNAARMSLAAHFRAYGIEENGLGQSVLLLSDKIREAATNPEATQRKVYNELADIRMEDPELADQLEKHYLAKLDYLNKNAPQTQQLSPFFDKEEVPNDAEAASFGRRVLASDDPTVLLDELAEGRVNQETVETVRALYPRVFRQIENMAVEKLMGMRSLDYAQRLALSQVFQLPLEPTTDPAFVSSMNSFYTQQSQPENGPGKQGGYTVPNSSRNRKSVNFKNLGISGTPAQRQGG